jgi:hypothetical protein
MICEIANLVFSERDFKERKFIAECDSNNNFFSSKCSWLESCSLETLLCAFHAVQTRSAYWEN